MVKGQRKLGIGRHRATGAGSAHSGHAQHVGRVGALAVALGVGFAVATSPGVAWADTSADGNASPDSPSDSTPADGGGQKNPDAPDTSPESSGSGSRADETPQPQSGGATETKSSEVTETSEVAPGVVVRSSGGALTSGQKTSAEETSPATTDPDPAPTESTPVVSAAEPAVRTADPVEVVTPAAGPSEDQAPQHDSPSVAEGEISGGAADPTTKAAPSTSRSSGGMQTPTALRIDEAAVQQAGATGRESAPAAVTPFAALDAAAVEPAPPANFIEALSAIPATFLNAAATLVNNVLQALFVPAPGTTDPPLLAAVLAFVRRTFSTFANATPTLNPQQTSQDLDDREVHGTFGGADADGDTLTYTVPGSGDGAPAHGTVTIDQAAGTWTYTPNVGFAGPDSFNVTASDEASGYHVHLFGTEHTTTALVSVTVTPPVDANDPPIVTPPSAPSAPDATTGEVTGSLGVVDPDGDPLTIAYAEGGAPKYGTVEFDSVTGTYTYTPNQAGKLRAGLGLGSTDSFTVVVTQGGVGPAPFARTASFSALDADDPGFSETVTINDIQIPGVHLVVDSQPIPALTPAGIVVTDRYAYVLDSQASSVTVIDTSDNTVVGDPIPVGSYPVLAASGPGRVYVVNAFGGTVTIVDTASNTVDGQPIPVAAGSSSPALSPDGSRLFITNSSTGGVYVVDTVTRSVVDADPSTPQLDPIIVGSPPVQDGQEHYVPNGGIAFSEDGTRLYVTRQHLVVVNGVYASGDGDVVVIGNDPSDPSSYLKLIGDPIVLTGKIPAAAAVAGKRLYVGTFNTSDAGPVNGAFPSGTVMVVDIDPDSPTFQSLVDVDPSTPAVDGIGVGPLPLNIAVSPDKSLGYTVNLGAGTVSVIDFATSEKIYEFTYSTGPQVFGTPSIVGISPDGTKLYVSNYGANNVTAVTIT